MSIIEQAKKIRAERDAERQSLQKAESKLSRIWTLLPAPSEIPTPSEFWEMLQNLRKIRENKE